ncbi:MAG TPA: hypothetical protein VIM55_10345 [Mucilaginibacter sp.]
METKELAKKAINNNAKTNPVTEENKNPKFVAGNTVNKESAKPEAVKSEPLAEPVKTEHVKTEAAAPAQEPSKKEIKQEFAAQQARKLEETERLVEQLAKKIAQKKKLHGTITNLDEFTVVKDTDDDMASDSRFARCELSIKDDEGREFSTKNPFIIAYVAHEVKQLCIDKLAEVEASIVIP